jgi:hypothetical protein
MAQAKTRAPAKRSQGSKKTQARSRGSSSRSKNRSSNRSKSSPSTKSQSSPSTKSQSSSSKSNGVGRVDSARKAVEHTAKDAGHAVGRAASKAKVPLMTGGAALMGAAGGMALGVRQTRRHRRIGMAIPRRPQVKVKSRDLAKAAKEVGSFGAQMGQLASELQRAREGGDGGKRRSPVEVVLEGLTARRSR